MVLDLDYALGSDQKLKMRADSVRKLITEDITVRLALPPLLNIYSRTVESGNSSLLIYFGMLANMIGRMDKTSAGYLPRAISFYGLVNKLAENHRSLFVPYFKYLLENCVHYLAVGGDAKPSGLTRKKKAKIQDSDNSMFLGNWHLRALVLSSLHKCFLYDAGSMNFLDSSNFQVLL